jgi:ribose 1,5-bisphosphate isomerase
MDKFERICNDIKTVKIQGATNVAKAGVQAYCLHPKKSSIKILSNLRPTEPMLFNSLRVIQKSSLESVLNHFDNSQEFINHYIQKTIQGNPVIFTHCHSSTLVKALIEAYKNKKKFSVINTETRPLYQGHLTSKQLSRAGIEVSMSIDSAILEDIKKSDLIMLGADAITKKGVLNKIGSGLIAKISKDLKKPLYIVTDSWKFSPKKISIEKRSWKEIWSKSPKKVNIENPAFEWIPKNQISNIISELGILSHKDFIKSAKKALKNY